MCWDSFVVLPSDPPLERGRLLGELQVIDTATKTGQTYLLFIIGPDSESEAVLQAGGSCSQCNISHDLPKLSRALPVPEDVHTYMRPGG